MTTIYDLIEVTSITANTTYSQANGNLLGIVDEMSGTSLNDGEFDVGDIVFIDGVSYRIDNVDKPSSAGSFLLGDGSSLTFSTASESNLDVVFLTLSSGGTTRYFIIPNDKFGDFNLQAVTTGGITRAAGNDAKIISTVDNDLRIVCFAAGTMIEVFPGQSRPVEDLVIGDPVLTADHGQQPIRWIGSRHLSANDLRGREALWPIRIEPGALGRGQPRNPLLLSPQHRVLLRSRIVERMVGAPEVLVAALHLEGAPGVRRLNDPEDVTYFHILLDRHEILFADGIACESLYLGPEAERALGPDVISELGLLFPGLTTSSQSPPPCRPMVSGRRGRNLVERHLRNGKPFCADPPSCSGLALPDPARAVPAFMGPAMGYARAAVEGAAQGPGQGPVTGGAGSLRGPARLIQLPSRISAPPRRIQGSIPSP